MLTHTIRRCVPGDAAMLALLGSATFLETYVGYVAADDILLAARQWHDPDFYAAWLARDDVDIHLAEADAGRAALGYVALVPHGPEPGRLEIKRIYLLHRFQRTGLGHRLMETALAAAKARKAVEVCLDVAEFNAHAIAFYTSFGFNILSTRPLATPDHSYPVHTLVMTMPAPA
jgi:ribosomal protein S18 acetylase RimI-like enzyme